MSATRVIRHLLEEPDDEPLGMNPLEPYVGPLEFDNSVKDIINHAQFLKEQATEAGALALVAQFRPADIDRAFLLIAVEQHNDRFLAPGKIARQLKREMHSIWD